MLQVQYEENMTYLFTNYSLPNATFKKYVKSIDILKLSKLLWLQGSGGSTNIRGVWHVHVFFKREGCSVLFFSLIKIIFLTDLLLLLDKTFNKTTWKTSSSFDRHKEKCLKIFNIIWLVKLGYHKESYSFGQYYKCIKI